MCCKNVLNKKNQRDIIYKFNQICWFYFNYIIKKNSQDTKWTKIL
jgi:hypothetical protein